LIWLAPLVFILAATPLLVEIRDLISVMAGFRGVAADETGG
jgi:hypothetical protein